MTASPFLHSGRSDEMSTTPAIDHRAARGGRTVALLTPQDLLARVLYRDALMLVLDKPAGIPVHAGPGGGPNLEELFDTLRYGLPRPPALAHRLDRDTSGCLILGRHRKALARLGKLFAAGKIDKVYWSVVRGGPEGDTGTIDLPLAKLTPKRGWKMIGDPAGQPAVTDWRVLGRGEGTSWLECRPRTGRTHQVRVHLQALGCPILGDAVYGDGAADVPLHLHARAVIVPLYPARAPIAVVAPPPAHMLPALRQCGWTDNSGAALADIRVARP
jgi:RluA family pseudouridine synthase